MRSRRAWSVLALWLAGCAVGPEYRAPEPETPDRWHQELVRGLETGEADLRTWWRVFGDPTLDSLIERAAAGSLDVREAIARIDEARALLGIARGEFAPDVDGTGTAQRTRDSEAVLGVVIPPGDRTDTFYGSGFDSFWELDVWGRIRRSVESAGATYEATNEDYRDVLVSLYADIASAYVDVRTFQARIESALSNVEAQRGTLQLTRDRLDAGIGNELDVSQAQLNLASTESSVPPLRQALAAAIHRVGVLLGQPPASLHAELGQPAPTPGPSREIVIGLPAELLRQRPDIRRAERLLAAQNARIGVATAALYPSFSLVGSFGVESFAADDLFDSGSTAYGFGPTFRWNLFDGGRVRNAIRAEEADTQQSLLRYERSVLRALEDLENSLVAYVQESERRDALQRAVEASRKSVRLVNVLYRNGLTDFQNVLDMERSQFEQEDLLAASRGLVSSNLIRIYRALGGGWGVAAP